MTLVQRCASHTADRMPKHTCIFSLRSQSGGTTSSGEHTTSGAANGGGRAPGCAAVSAACAAVPAGCAAQAMNPRSFPWKVTCRGCDASPSCTHALLPSSAHEPCAIALAPFSLDRRKNGPGGHARECQRVRACVRVQLAHANV
eukprot:363811-Chlamydomonas_euryale.AAC.5